MQNHLTSIATWAALLVTAFSVPNGLAAAKESFKIGACDWSIRLPLSEKSLQFAERNGLTGVQYSFDATGKGLDLRLRENRDTIRQTVKETGVAISSLGIGLLNKVPLATTKEADRRVIECIETMVKLKQEAAALKDSDLAAKVSPQLVPRSRFA
jgi:hypothetical protein